MLCAAFRSGGLVAAVIGASLLPAVAVAAEQSWDLDRILFEAHPLPATADVDLPFRAAASLPRFRFIGNSATPAPTADRSQAEATVLAYQSNLEALQENVESPYSSALFEQLLGLSVAYRQLGRYEEALTTLDKAEHLSRINNGLYAPDQFAVVEQMVESHLESGDIGQAMAKQQYLLYLQQQYFGAGSLELVPAFERLGDWAMQSFRSGVQGSVSTGIRVGTGNGRRGQALSPRAMAVGNLDLARFRYFSAIRNLVRNRDYRNPQLLVLEEKMLQSLYLVGHRNGLMNNPTFYLGGRTHLTGTRISVSEFDSNMQVYAYGRQSLERLMLYQQFNTGSDPHSLLQTQLNLADWHLLFNREREAVAAYAKAATLASTPRLAAQAQQLLNPVVAPQLPAFMPLPHSRGANGIAESVTQEFVGYIDIALEISRNGDVSEFEVIGKTANVTAALENRLRRLVISTPHRPTLENGVPVVSARQQRYFFAELL